MGRPTKHTDSEILDATRDLIVKSGPRSAGISSITEVTGAPVGSLYHRYGSRDELIATLWLRTVLRFQDGFLTAAQHPEPFEASLGMALWTLDFATKHNDDARLLLNHSYRGLLDGGLSTELEQRLKNVNEPVIDVLSGLSKRFCGRSNRGCIERLTQALVDLPYATVKRHLTSRGKLTSTARRQLEANVTAILKGIQNEANQQRA